MPNAEPENSAGTVEENSLDETGAPRDEFLGFVGTAEVSEQDNTEQAPFADENALEATKGDASAPVSSIGTNSQDEKVGAKSVEPDNSLNEATLETENAEPERDESQEANQPTGSSEAENIQAETSPKQNSGAITLPEKEPYQFDKCTVTATIQLLPVGDGIRRAVLSVRTHDFAPQISVVELNDGATPAQLLPALESAFERYKTDLPAKVMDKMKREKSAGKKQTVRTMVETKPSQKVNRASAGGAETESKAVETAVVPKPENDQAAANTVSAAQSAATNTPEPANRGKADARNAKPQDDRQGNLFSF